MQRVLATLEGLRNRFRGELEEATAAQVAATEARRAATARVRELEAEILDIERAVAALEGLEPAPEAPPEGPA